MRLIDADALMELARNHISKSVDCNDIARFPTAANWTPCSVALPNEHETVLVTVEDEHGNDVMLAWHGSSGWQNGYSKNLPILAWQPLPGPYRGEVE